MFWVKWILRTRLHLIDTESTLFLKEMFAFILKYTKETYIQLWLYFSTKDINRTYLILPIFMMFYKIFSLLWSFLLKIYAHNSLFIFWGHIGPLLHNVLIALTLAQALCWAACLSLPATSVFTCIAGSLRALLQILSASLKTRPQGIQPKSKSPRSVTLKTLPWLDLPSTDILM